LKAKKLWSSNSVIRFIAVGITNTIIDFAILNILVFAFGLNKIVANSISVTIAMLVSYSLNHYVVFRQSNENHARKFVLFIIITAFGLFAIQNLIIYFFVHIFTWPGNVATNVLHFIGLNQLSKAFVILNFAKAIASAATLVWNYFMYKKFVFTKSKAVAIE
jgi:putative flippase GtrA